MIKRQIKDEKREAETEGNATPDTQRSAQELIDALIAGGKSAQGVKVQSVQGTQRQGAQGAQGQGAQGAQGQGGERTFCERLY